ncbi:TadE/TadG family type IV pilus assembly protein [Methylobacterium platani]|uniref:Uncharacterized protein n=2 Tax=Methylobacterium platani TaxID=427683 RepID=A0A179S2W0_9HYPH|nr:TadE/TadG family type IV pilus assembly protein [Methylobacterium platani]KMO12037.1 hypothetical protein SQ03_25470 [Methylobacterium platani JCM 14648]OAS20018.1 hypothetical protein A5481_23180 [Methylobacterium platani]
MRLRSDLALALARFRHDRRGTIVMLFGVLLPIVAMGMVGAAEIAEVMLARSKLQGDVDAAALQGAGEFGVDQSAATAERTRLYADDMAAPLRRRWTIASTVAIDAASRAVTVRQTAHRASFFGSLLPPGGWTLQASATAVRTARKPLCVLGLQGGGPLGNPDSIALQGNSAVAASDCLVQSNASLTAAGASSVRAGEARAAGSASGAISPAAVTDAPALPDPFAGLRIDAPVLCQSIVLGLGSNTVYLKPGVHCSTITVLGDLHLILEPGEHYFVGPTLNVGGRSTISGSDVVVILAGVPALQVTGNAVLDLEGRRSGPFAGFVLVSARSFVGDVAISTNNARRLIGTVYLPNASLTVSGNNNRVADQSPWTVVVARTIRTQGSATLTINANYALSPVPTPPGVGPPKDQPARLTQ